MRRILLPGTDLNLSVIGLGTGSFGTAVARDLAFQMLDVFVEAGGNLLDTAHIYAACIPGGWGASERTIGEWMAARGTRGSVLVGTKGGHPDWSSMRRPRLSPAEIEHDLRESLERLRTDHVDLYWMHRDDPRRPVGEILEALNAHIQAGLVRAIGASNWSVERLNEAAEYARAHGVTGFCASQIGWSFARTNRGAGSDLGTFFMDDETYQYHLETRLPVAAFSSQGQGFFSGKYHRGMAAESGKAKSIARRYFHEENFARLDRARELAARLGRTPNQIALAYLTNQPFPAVAVIGPKSVEQLRDSCGTGDLLLSKEDLSYLDGIQDLN
ncbi:MAG: aldo/keto reductase [Candidatus Sumerlaeota bacterium]|nr:aldo/keto reductase [Candidatus Sumerlaeota bacterium]